jgi:hypothetical protein
VLADAFECITSSPDPRRAAIAALLATHGGDRGPITVTSDPGLQFRAVDAFTALAEELALSGPLVIGVDDLQGADRSSSLTLAAFSRCLAYLPVALVGCLRPVPRLAELERLADALEAAGARQLALTPLAADAGSTWPAPSPARLGSRPWSTACPMSLAVLAAAAFAGGVAAGLTRPGVKEIRDLCAAGAAAALGVRLSRRARARGG